MLLTPHQDFTMIIYLKKYMNPISCLALLVVLWQFPTTIHAIAVIFLLISLAVVMASIFKKNIEKHIFKAKPRAVSSCVISSLKYSASSLQWRSRACLADISQRLQLNRSATTSPNSSQVFWSVCGRDGRRDFCEAHMGALGKVMICASHSMMAINERTFNILWVLLRRI